MFLQYVYVFLSGDGDSWNHLGFGDTFTEDDVSNNRLRYLHTSVIGTKAQVKKNNIVPNYITFW